MTKPADLVRIAHHIRRYYANPSRAKRYMYLTEWAYLQGRFPGDHACWTIAGAVRLGHADAVVAAMTAVDAGVYV